MLGSLQVLGRGRLWGPAAPWGGMGSFHGHPAAFPTLPRLLEGGWDLLAPSTAPAGFWVLEVGPAAPGEASTEGVQSRFIEA